MNICMISSEFPPISGGIGTYVYNLSKKLVERGNSVTVITRGNIYKTYVENFENIKVYRVRFLPIYKIHPKIFGFFVSRFLSSFDERFDIIHVHSPPPIIIKTKKPKMLTVHSLSHTLSRLKIVDRESLITKILSKIYIDTELDMLKSSERITVVSNFIKVNIAMYDAYKKIDVIYNGVDTKFFKPICKKSKSLSILYSGRLDYNKGLIDLIKSSKYILEVFPDAIFIIAGDGPYKKQLFKLVNKMNLGKNFIFTGFINKNDLLYHYQNTTVYVLPSYYEGFPTALLESMSCGIPSVATSISGNNEIINNGSNGLLVSIKNPEELAKKILIFLNDEELRDKIGKNGRDHIEQNYDWEIITTNIEKIYGQII